MIEINFWYYYIGEPGMLSRQIRGGGGGDMSKNLLSKILDMQITITLLIIEFFPV